MQQSFRRYLLALGPLDGEAASVDRQCQQFIRSVLTARLEVRPDTQGVLDVLQSNHVATAVAARFTQTFDAAVWHAA